MSAKRRHNELTLKIKYEALKELEEGRSNKEVAHRFNVPASTLATWKKHRDKICEAYQNSPVKRQRIRTGSFEKINQALLKWYTCMDAQNLPVNGPILSEKALEFAKTFHYNDFKASNGWLQAWKKRYIYCVK